MDLGSSQTRMPALTAHPPRPWWIRKVHTYRTQLLCLPAACPEEKLVTLSYETKDCTPYCESLIPCCSVLPA